MFFALCKKSFLLELSQRQILSKILALEYVKHFNGNTEAKYTRRKKF